jgi:hypothetical protein
VPNGIRTRFTSESDWTDPGSSGTLARRMYALHAIATQQPSAAIERSVAMRVKGRNGMTFDLPRGS